jgi:hypothetical protein
MAARALESFLACLSRSEREVLRAVIERLISAMEADNLSVGERRVMGVSEGVLGMGVLGMGVLGMVVVVVVVVVVLVLVVLSIMYVRE